MSPRLMHQQCWLWGCDIRRPQGNLLLDYGFHRARQAAGVSGSSRYTFRFPDWQLDLWGFGAVCTSKEVRFYLNRYEVEPRLIADPQWPANDASAPPGETGLATGPISKAVNRTLCEQTAQFFLWISAYEEWVLRSQGLRYRHDTMRAWTHSAYLPACLPELWTEAAAGMLVRICPKEPQ